MRLEQVQAIKEMIRRDAMPQAENTEGLTANIGPVLEDIANDPERPRGVAVGIGLTEKDDDYRVAVRVPDERAEQWFKSKYQALLEQHGADIDVRIIRRATAQREVPEAGDPLMPLSIGARVRHERGSDGTLAFFARRGRNLGIVSCNHVLALTDRARVGDDIVHVTTGEKVARLASVSLLRRISRPQADCAFAELNDDKFAPAVPGRVNGFVLKRGAVPQFTKYLPVVKVGAITGITHGRISALALVDLDVDYGEFFAFFDDVLEIESMEVNADGEKEAFADDGDSGSIVFTEDDLNPLGMLFYKTVGGTDNSGLSYASPISSIENALGVQIVL